MDPQTPQFTVDPTPVTKQPWLSSHRILGIVFLIAVAAAIVSGIYYWQTVRNLPTSYDAIVHKDPTADWKTYTNDQYGFEFKYPFDLQYKDYGPENDLISNFAFFNNDFEIDTGIRTSESFKKYNDNCEGGCELAQPLDCEKNSNSCSEYKIREFRKTAAIRNITKNYTVELTTYLDYDSKLDGTIVDDETLKQKIAEGKLPQTNLRKVTLFNQILSTFKFIDNSSIQTYKDSKHGFEFDYSSNVAVGHLAGNSSLGEADMPVPGFFVGHFVFVVADTPQVQQAAEKYFNGYAEVASNPSSGLSEDGPSIGCKLTKINNYILIQLVDCVGEGGPATYGLIKTSGYEIFIDGYSKGWGDYEPTYLSETELIKILESFRFTQ